MAVATPKQTGGGGFEFESKVAAYFISHLLADIPAFDDGRIVSIQFQAGNDGWLFDDFLLTVRKNSTEYKIATSSKSNAQFTANGIPKDVGRDLWTQYLNDQSNVFNKGKDRIALIVSSLPRKLFQDVTELLQWASVNKPNALHKRLVKGKISSAKNKIFKSFKCPRDLAKKYKIKPADTWQLLSRLLIKEFDFETQVSESEKTIIQICRDCLVGKNFNEAKKLYRVLADQRNILAPLSGVSTYDSIVETIKYDFKLVGFRDHTKDWKKIGDNTKTNISIIPTQIGGKLQVDRRYKLEDLKTTTGGYTNVFILGRSGTGKSNLASQFATEKVSHNIKVIWLNVFNLENEFATNLHLGNSVSDLLTRVQDQEV